MSNTSTSSRANPLFAPRKDPIEGCRACGETGLYRVLDLGLTPLANRLLAAEQLSEPEPTYPLELVFCPKCSLVQITETVPPEELFSHYLYFSSFSDTVVNNAREVVGLMRKRKRLTGESLVVEVASNDGYLLQFYKEVGVPVVGIEPAANISKVAVEERGIRTINAFFGRDCARRLAERGERADVIHANNVLAHVADTNGFIEGFAILLKDDGVVVVEAPYLRDTVEGTEFDQIYHEHLCYFSLTSLDSLFRSHGLTIFDVQHIAIHGGSLRIFARREPDEPGHVGRAVRDMLDEERRLGMDTPDYYRDFASRVERLKADLRELLGDLKSAGKRIAVYGASAKGATLLNYFEIGAETLDWVADRSTAKQGLCTPGTRLPIVPPERMLEDQPDYVLLLSWNFRDEILGQQAAYRERGGRFIIPIPKLEVV